ncbi:Peroxisomal membrane protein PMP27 [Metarhizium acridum]|nr:Peroxisomal membrane protein PMP27 [Metarhizium acridum]
MVVNTLVYHPSVKHYLSFVATTVGPRQAPPHDPVLRPLLRLPIDAFLRYAGIGRQIGYAGYLTFDSAALPDAAGIKKGTRPRPSRPTGTDSGPWACYSASSAQLYTLYQLKQREAKIDRKDGEGVINSKHIARERAASQLQLISDLCDLTVPSSALGWAGFDDGFVGLAGTLSSLIGVYNQWKKVTAKPASQ